jgi:hypothetical protein
MKQESLAPEGLCCCQFLCESFESWLLICHSVTRLPNSGGRSSKTSIVIGGAQDLVPELETVKVAVLAGELDSQIEAASGALRSGFKR